MTLTLDLVSIRIALLRHLDEIEALAPTNADNRAIIAVDQQSVGRISRIDALQHQALAQEIGRRRGAESLRVKAALSRLDTDEFGWCQKCGEAIAERRLAVDPSIVLCISCAR